MAVICFASLKGGVGKTSAAVNVAHALAHRGCETLLIDLDPTCHATRFFSDRMAEIESSPLVRLFTQIGAHNGAPGEELLEAAADGAIELHHPVRPRLDILPGASDLRHFLREKNAAQFLTLFPLLLAELQTLFDYIVIDTAPDFHVLGRAAVGHAALTVVPVDGSAMSIASLEELVDAAAEYREPCWAVLRMMVNRSASRIARLSADRLAETMPLSPVSGKEEGRSDSGSDEKPVFLLENVIGRSEEQNRLSYCNRTTIDFPTSPLALQYMALARELEHVLTLCEESADDGSELDGEFWSFLANQRS